MNAIPNQSHGYQRIIIPSNVQFQRNIEMGRLEYFDDIKARKSENRSTVQKRAVSKNFVVNNISEFNRVSGAKNNARQITPAYEVQKKQYMNRNDYYKSNAATSANRNNDNIRNTRVNNVSSFKKTNYSNTISANRQFAYSTSSDYAQNPNYNNELAQPIKKQSYKKNTYETNTVNKAVKIKKNRTGFGSTIFVVMFTFIVLAGLLTRYAQISNLSYNNAKIESNIMSMEKELQKIQMDIALKDDLENVQERAEAELNMSHPGDDRTVYLPKDEIAEDESSVYITGKNKGSEDTQQTPTTPITPEANTTNKEEKVQTNNNAATNDNIDFNALFKKKG